MTGDPRMLTGHASERWFVAEFINPEEKIRTTPPVRSTAPMSTRSKIGTRRFRVDVTRADIDQGYAPSSAGCPLALAVRRLFPDALVVAVGVHIVGVWSDGGWRAYPLPRGVAKRQMDMIAKRPVEPFQFWLGDDDGACQVSGTQLPWKPNGTRCGR